MAGLTPDQIVKQSWAAFNQWEHQWKEHALAASKFPMKDLSHFQSRGAGRACLLIGNGASFEREIETIKKYAHLVDIMVCDKALGHCIENGITPTYCLVADANVSYEKYLEPWKDKLHNTILFQSVCANPKWIDGANWKGTYFYCVKDAIETEKIFQKISGCPNIVAAGTNVSNSMLIFLTQCDNQRRENYFGYDKYLLIGYDYSWKIDGNYYAFDHDGKGKRYYMRHNYGRTIGGDICVTSNNLAFSLKWIEKYIEAFKLPVIQCSKDSVLQTPLARKGYASLEEQMQYKGTVKAEEVRQLMQKSREVSELQRKIGNRLNVMAKTQYYDFAASL